MFPLKIRTFSCYILTLVRRPLLHRFLLLGVLFTGVFATNVMAETIAGTTVFLPTIMYNEANGVAPSKRNPTATPVPTATATTVPTATTTTVPPTATATATATATKTATATATATATKTATATATPVPPTATAVPTSSTSLVYWGAYIKGNTYGYGDAPWDTRTIDTFESNANKKLSILHWGQPWYWSTQGGYQTFPRNVVEKVRLRGSIPMINWNSWDLSKGGSTDQPEYQLIDITNGQHDAYIRQWARDAKAWGHPFFVRFNHEMNGTWYPWSEVKNGNSSGQYAQVWRHVHDIFRQEGATNVTWVWAPNTVYAGAIPLSGLYPGDSYVDWAGMDAYNWGTNPAKPNVWQTFSQVVKPTYDQLQTLAPSKPIMISELGSTEYGGSKAAWINDAFQTQLPTNFRNIKAVVWFNWNIWEHNGIMDWTIETSSSTQSAFATSIGANYFASNNFGNLPLLSKVKPLSNTVTTTSANMVQESSFEGTGSSTWYAPWTTRNDLGATFTQDATTAVAGSKSFKMSLPGSASTQPWVVQVRQGGKALSLGKTYTLSFYAKAAVARPIAVMLQQSGSPYTEYFKQTANLSTGWTKYTYTYTPSVSDSNVTLAFNLAQVSGDLWIDDVSLVAQ